MVPYITHPNATFTNIRYGFFTRQGGVSTGIYESLNCGYGSDDDPAAAAENRMRVAAVFNSTPIHFANPHLIHSADALLVDTPLQAPHPKVDALVTKTPGVVLTVLTADCAPIALIDPMNDVVGLAHAGWRGALDGIIENTVAVMKSAGADPANIHGIIGPCIRAPSYEVDDKVRQQFLEASQSNSHFFQPNNNARWQFDMAGFITRILQENIQHVYDVERDTYAEEEHFFSYRRATHRKEPDNGRLISAVQIKTPS